MTNDVLEYPVISPTTTIIFNAIVDIARGRSAMNSEDFGSNDGNSRQAASNRTQLDMQLSFKLITNSTSSVRQKVKELATLFKNYAKNDMKITINYADGGTCIWTGKIVDERGIFEGGKGATVYLGTIDMNVKTEVWS